MTIDMEAEILRLNEVLEQAQTDYENERGYAMDLIGEKEVLQKQLEEAHGKIQELEERITLLEDRA